MLRGFRIARELVEAYRHRLPKVHRDILFARWDAHQPVTVAEVLVREAELLRSEQQGDTVRSELLADEARTVFQLFERVLQLTVTYRGSSDYERAVGDGFGHALVLLCVREQR